MQRLSFGVGATLLIILSGCTAPADNPLDAVPGALELANALQLVDKKGFKIDQPVDVFLIGFEAGMGEKVSGLLAPEEVAGAPLDYVINFPPTPEGTTDDQVGEPLPAVPRAIYSVHEMSPMFAHDLFEHVLANPVKEGPANTYDANAAEDWLADNIPQEGHAWDSARTAFVVLHAHGHLPKDHAWRFAYTNGFLEPVRAFGERYPFVVYDVSAKPDPFVVAKPFSATGLVFNTVFGAPEVKDYNYHLEAGGDKTAKNLKKLVIDATHYRLLQPAIYAVSTKPCHHVTLLLGIHATSATEIAKYGKGARSLVDVPGLKSSFEHLTGDGVTVDLKVLMLPQDDPVMDAFMRTAANGALVVFPFLDAMRWYLDMNWERYVTKQAPCEEYLSLLIFGDVATRGDFGGIGTYDVKTERRISFSLWNDISRVRDPYTGPAEEQIRTRQKSDDPWNRVNLLYSHETGHLFGQHHPQHLVHAKGASPSIDTFQSVWSVMSYQTGQRLHDFGKIDTANWQRNRVGYTIQQAQQAGLTSTPEFQAAVEALKAYDWTEAHLALEAKIPGESGGKDYHAGESHAHPEFLNG